MRLGPNTAEYADQDGMDLQHVRWTRWRAEPSYASSTRAGHYVFDNLMAVGHFLAMGESISNIYQ